MRLCSRVRWCAQINATFNHNLSSLYLNNNNISSLEGATFNDNLHYLFLNNNIIDSIDKVKFNEDLQCLYLNGNNISSIDVSNLPYLTLLDIGNNLIQIESISNLTNLTTLNL